MSSSPSSSLGARITLQDPVDPVEMTRGTPIVSAAFADEESFLEAFDPGRGPAGELTVVTRSQLPSKTAVVLEVRWPSLPNRVYLRAVVFRRRLGLVVRLHPDEGTAARFLVEVARSGLPAAFHKRSHRRYCVRLPVLWRRFGDSQRWDGLAEDLSAGGMLIATTSAAPPVGERVGMRLIALAAAQDLVLTGQVMHARQRGDDAAFGVTFEYRSGAEQRSLRRLLRVFAARGVVILT